MSRMDEIGQIYLEIGTIRGNYLADIILGVIEGYHFLPDMTRELKDKNKIIDEVICQKGMDGSVTLSICRIYDDFVTCKIEAKNIWLLCFN